MSESRNEMSLAPPGKWPMTTTWTMVDVYRYICDIGYSKYAKCFSRNAVTGTDLIHLTAFDLQRLGVDRMEDAIRMHALISASARTMLYNFDYPGRPPNVSYLGARNRSVNFSQHPENACLKLPPLPGKDELCLPYRDDGERCYRYRLPVQSYHDHCMSMGRTDAWKMYNSLF